MGRSILDKLLPKQKKIYLCLAWNNESEGRVFDFKNIFFLSSSLSNLISLTIFNNSRIYYNNKNKTLYNVNTKEVLVQTKR